MGLDSIRNRRKEEGVKGKHKERMERTGQRPGLPGMGHLFSVHMASLRIKFSQVSSLLSERLCPKQDDAFINHNGCYPPAM